MRSAAVTQPRMRSELVPVTSASLSRCFGRLGRAQEPDGGANPFRLEERCRVRPDASDVGDRYAIDASPRRAAKMNRQRQGIATTVLPTAFVPTCSRAMPRILRLTFSICPCSAPPPIMRMPAPIISLMPKPPALSLAASRSKALAHRAWPRAVARCLLVLP